MNLKIFLTNIFLVLSLIINLINASTVSVAAVKKNQYSKKNSLLALLSSREQEFLDRIRAGEMRNFVRSGLYLGLTSEKGKNRITSDLKNLIKDAFSHEFWDEVYKEYYKLRRELEFKRVDDALVESSSELAQIVRSNALIDCLPSNPNVREDFLRGKIESFARSAVWASPEAIERYNDQLAIKYDEFRLAIDKEWCKENLGRFIARLHGYNSLTTQGTISRKPREEYLKELIDSSKLELFVKSFEEKRKFRERLNYFYNVLVAGNPAEAAEKARAEAEAKARAEARARGAADGDAEYVSSEGISREEACRILGVPLGATRAQINKAYRALALKWHPDKKLEDPDAKEMFQRIASAYRVLIN